MMILKIPISKLKEPFEKIDVKDYDEIYIDGYKFPYNNLQNRLLKQPNDYEGLILKIKSKIRISEDEEDKAIDILKGINYYKLSVFIKLLDGNNTFSRLIQLFEFDSFLKREIMPLLQNIENLFKASITYFLVNHYKDAEFYLDYDVYETRNKKKVDKIISKFAENIVGKAKKELYIKRHIEQYGGHIPFWVLVETLTFGEIIYFYNFLSKDIRKKWRTNFLKVEVVKESELEWLKTLQFLRNDCAHDNRLFGRTFNFVPLIHKEDMNNIFGKEQVEMSLLKRKHTKEKEKYDELKVRIEKQKKTLFSGLIVMRYFIESSTLSTKEAWNIFLDKLDKEIEANNIQLYRIGFVKNWKIILQCV